MTEHWNEHSLDFSRSSDRKFDSTEGTWDENKTGFTIDTPVTEDDMKVRRQDYEDTNPDVANLQRRQGYTNHVRADKSYRFLMMVAAFSKKKLGTVMNVKQKSKPTTTITYADGVYFNSPSSTFTYVDGIPKLINQSNVNQGVETETVEYGERQCDSGGGGACGVVENTGKIGGQAWLTMPEISGNIQLTPEVYGHIMEAQMIVGSFTKRPIKLKTLVEDTPYQTLFARLVAIRMGLTKYFDSSDKQKDKIFSRLHQEQTMLLRRIRTVTEQPTTIDYTNSTRY